LYSFSSNLSVSQSSFDHPCNLAPDGVDSGLLVPIDSNTRATWSFKLVDDKTPLFFFCAQVVPDHHCHEGMVFAINDNEEQPFGSFQVNQFFENKNESLLMILILKGFR
jgi:hypothetical protein